MCRLPHDLIVSRLPDKPEAQDAAGNFMRNRQEVFTGTLYFTVSPHPILLGYLLKRRASLFCRLRRYGQLGQSKNKLILDRSHIAFSDKAF